MCPVGFEPTKSAGERPQAYALDRAAIGTGARSDMIRLYFLTCNLNLAKFSTSGVGIWLFRVIMEVQQNCFPLPLWHYRFNGSQEYREIPERREIQGDSKRWAELRTSVFPEIYTVCE